MKPRGTGAEHRAEGALARASRFLALRRDTRIWRTPRLAVLMMVCGLGMVGGGLLSTAHGGPWLDALSVPLGSAVCLQGISDFLVGRSPRAVAALRALAALGGFFVVSGWAWSAASGNGLAALALVFGFGIVAIALAIKKADARRP